MGVGGQRHVPAALSPKKETRYPLCRRLGGLQGRSERMREITSPPGLDPRNIQHVASRYIDWIIPAHTEITIPIQIEIPLDCFIRKENSHVA